MRWWWVFQTRNSTHLSGFPLRCLSPNFRHKGQCPMLPLPLRTMLSTMPFRCRSMSFPYLPIFRLLLVSFGLGGSGRFFFFSPLRMSEISLCRLPTASVVFVSGASQRSGLDDARFVGQNTTWACEGGDFSGQPQAAWPCSSVLSRNYLCPSNENDILMLVLKEAWKRRHTHGEVKRKRERMVWRNAP